MFIVDDNGNAEIYQGDSGTLIVEDLPTDKSYTLYFAIYNEKRQRVGNEIFKALAGADVADINIPASLTDLLTVPRDEDYKDYYYGLKLCIPSTEEEDTLVIDDGDIGTLNTLRVYPKKVEGIS